MGKYDILVIGKSTDDPTPLLVAAGISGAIDTVYLLGPKAPKGTAHCFPQREIASEQEAPPGILRLPATGVCGPELFRKIQVAERPLEQRKVGVANAGARAAYEWHGSYHLHKQAIAESVCLRGEDSYGVLVCCPPLESPWSG